MNIYLVRTIEPQASPFRLILQQKQALLGLLSFFVWVCQTSVTESEGNREGPEQEISNGEDAWENCYSLCGCRFLTG